MPRENDLELPEEVAFIRFEGEDGSDLIYAEKARFTVPNAFVVTGKDGKLVETYGVSQTLAEALSAMLQELTGKSVDVRITVHTE